MSILIFLILIGLVVVLFPYIIIGFVMVIGFIAAICIAIVSLFKKLTGR